jgi:hypothetical protein
MKGAARSAGRQQRRRRRGELLPCRRHHGERHPLAPFLHGFLGALPHGNVIHGEGKKSGFGGHKFVVWGVHHELGFLPLYSFSDFRHPI